MTVCPKHGIEMTLQEVSVPVTDVDGNESFRDEEIYSCYYCDHDINMDPLDYAEDGSEAEVILNERITKYKESNPDFNPHKVSGNLIGELMDFHKDTDADENPMKSMAMFQIASALTNCMVWRS